MSPIGDIALDVRLRRLFCKILHNFANIGEGGWMVGLFCISETLTCFRKSRYTILWYTKKRYLRR